MALAPKKSGKRRRVVKARMDDVVERMLASMCTYGEIVDHCVEEFGVVERTVATSIARVKTSWREADATTVEERRSKFRAELEHAWREALVAGDYRAIAVMARTRADVEGIKATKKIEHSGVLGLRPVAVMSPQERDQEIALLLAKRQQALAAPGAGSASVPTASRFEESGGEAAPAGSRVIDVEPGSELEHEEKPRKSKSGRKDRVH